MKRQSRMLCAGGLRTQTMLDKSMATRHCVGSAQSHVVAPLTVTHNALKSAKVVRMRRLPMPAANLATKMDGRLEEEEFHIGALTMNKKWKI
mmetsp:Transcript_85063/g.168792  ORF Transcript_85063/g.168792 Transcript_85063/m.168792 type:complete len:92 (+) Transcript_85063:147-422(+)